MNKIFTGAASYSSGIFLFLQFGCSEKRVDPGLNTESRPGSVLNARLECLIQASALHRLLIGLFSLHESREVLSHVFFNREILLHRRIMIGAAPRLSAKESCSAHIDDH